MFAAKTHNATPSRPSPSNGQKGGTFIQPKLNIGKPGDKYEVEADRMADMVVAKGNDQTSPFFAPVSTVQKQNEEDVQTQQEDTLQEKPLAETITPVIQLVPEEEIQEKTEDNEAKETLQKKGDEDTLQPKIDENTASPKETKESATPEIKTPIQKAVEENIQEKEDDEVQEKEDDEVQRLQMQSAGGDENPSSGLENNLNSSKGGGNPLASDTRQEMESGFGADFNGVRVHNDSNAVQMNTELGAQAFTSGNDIYFNEGKYNPGSDSGKYLLAHELTHTVQQGASSTSVQKTEDPAQPVAAETPSRPSSPIDIAHRLELNAAWASYLDSQYENGERIFDADVKIGEQYTGTIKLNKQRGTAEGEQAKYELSEGNHRYLEISGWSFLDPLRQAGVTPILVLREFGDSQQTQGFLSVKIGDNALIADVQGFIRGLNENLESMRFLGIEPINVDGLENTFENGRLLFQISALTTVVDGFLDAGGGMGITGSTFTFNLNANVEIDGLANGEFTIARGEDGSLSGTGDISADIANVSATIHVEYIDGVVTIQGTGRMNSDKFSGEITLLVTDEARSTQMMQAALGVEAMDNAADEAATPAVAAPKTRNNQVLAGWGEVQASITPWLEGTAKIGIDHEGHVTIVGEIIVPDEIELMEQRGKKVDLFDIEIRAGYGIPLVGQVFLFASVGMFVNAGFGPLVLKDVGFTGTYSTDPNVLQQFSITGTLGINAFAIIGLEAEAGVGVTLLGHDVKAGVNVTAAAGLRAYAEATPTFEYIEQQAPEGGKVGESHLKGHFEAAAQLFLQLTGALFYELDSPWWSPAPDGREEYPLGEVQYPIGDSLGIGADIDWLVGSPDAPELTFSPVEFDPDKFTADVMADPPPRTMGDADAEPEGEWTGEPGSEQNENPEITGDGEGLPPNSRREEDLANLPDEQKYMRALDEMSRLETANPKPTLSVVEAEARKVKRKYGVTKVETRDEQNEQVAVYVEHARENNSRHLLNIPLMSAAERGRLLADAMQALQTSSRNAADEEGKITRADAEEVLTALQRNHPVITDARVVDGQNTWDYFIDIGDREEAETGEGKKEDNSDIDTNADLSDVDEAFETSSGEDHELYFAQTEDSFTLMIASDPKTFQEFIAQLEIDTNNADAVSAKNQATTIATAIDEKKRERTGAPTEAETNANIEQKKQDLDDLLRRLKPHAAILMGIGENELPETQDPFYSTANVMGERLGFLMTVDVLTNIGDPGSPPSKSNTIWEKLKERNDGGRTYYVRGHLLNHNVHGPGNTWENLTILSQTGNRNHLNEAERSVKVAVDSGGIVKYHVIADYKGTRSDNVSDSDFQSAGVDPSKWEAIREIKRYEKHAVPEQLLLTADLLEPDGNGGFRQKQNLVSNKGVLNPVDTSLGSYEVGGRTTKENVSLVDSSAQKISANTGIDLDQIVDIQDAAQLVENLTRYDKIKDKMNELNTLSSSRIQLLSLKIDNLNRLSNVRLI